MARSKVRVSSSFQHLMIILTFGLIVAIHIITGQTVAMKYISKAAIYHNRTKTRVQREVEYMRALRHPHIIKLCVELCIRRVFCDLTLSHEPDTRLSQLQTTLL